MIPNGTYKARARGALLGSSPAKGTPEIAVEFELLEGDVAGERITWHGYFTESTTARTMEALRFCGWKTDDLDDLQGLGDTEVSLVIAQEEFQGKTYPRVQWVNRAGGIAMKTPMSEADRKAFAAKMRGAAIASRKMTAPANGAAPASPASGGAVKDDKLPF